MSGIGVCGACVQDERIGLQKQAVNDSRERQPRTTAVIVVQKSYVVLYGDRCDHTVNCIENCYAFTPQCSIQISSAHERATLHREEQEGFKVI